MDLLALFILNSYKTNHMKLTFLIFSLFTVTFNGYSQTMQATIKAGITPRTIDIYLKPSASFSQKDEAMTFVLAIPANVLPVPSMGSSGVTTNTTGAVTGITGLQLNFLIDNLGSAQREVYVSTETINGASYYIYIFIFAGTAAANHDWIANTEQQIFSIQFNGCTSNCEPMNELLVNLPNGGTNGNAYWYFQSNTIGDITNYAAPFYANAESGTPVNGGSGDGSALSKIALAQPVTLPIKLKSFNARANGCSVNTTWEIATEVNASYYVIERSESGFDFSEIGRLNAARQNEVSNNYSFLDNTAPAGTLYYRLKLLSKDGTYSYSDVEMVNLSCSGKGNIRVYPTLTKGMVNVRLPVGYERSIIRVINSVGQEVATDATNNLFRNINLKGLVSGTYLVQVINNNEIADNVKIVLAN